MGNRTNGRGRAADAELVRRARGGDREAFGQLVRRYQGAAYAAAVGLLGSHEDALDVVQDAFMAAYCGLGRLRDGKQFGPWLRTIVRRRVLDRIRSRRSARMALSAMADTESAVIRSSSGDYDRQRRRAELWEAVEALPEKYREVVLLHYVEHWPYKRIAAFTGLPVSTVKGRLQVARGRLKERLQAVEEGVATMEPTEVDRKVQEAICRIATEEIHETIPLGDTDNIVLYYAVHADIEICHTDGNDVILTGTKASIGHSEEDARASAAGIQILSDRVQDFNETEPHPHEVFSGTSKDDRGNPVAIKTQAKPEQWRMVGRSTFKHEKLYPEMSADDEAIQASIAKAYANATRISILRQQVDDIILPREAFTEPIRRVFQPNWIEEGRIHGLRGYVDLVVGVPVGKAITVLTPSCRSNIRVRALRSNINVVGPACVEVDDVEGDVCLFKCSVNKAQRIRGRLRQTHHGFGASEWGKDQMVRRPLWETVLRDISGEIHVDVGNIDLEVSNLAGQACIRNRFGATRYYQNRHEPGSKCRIESDSGGVRVFLKEELIGEVDVTVITLCGTIRHGALNSVGSLNKRNDLQLAVLTTIHASGPGMVPPHFLEADICVKTRDGDVTIEKTV